MRATGAKKKGALSVTDAKAAASGNAAKGKDQLAKPMISIEDDEFEGLSPEERDAKVLSGMQ